MAGKKETKTTAAKKAEVKKKPAKKPKAEKPKPEKKAPPIPKVPRDFYIVGMGASAGGLEAFEKFFQNVPPDPGMAFIMVPHLDPTHVSILHSRGNKGHLPVQGRERREGL